MANRLKLLSVVSVPAGPSLCDSKCKYPAAYYTSGGIPIAGRALRSCEEGLNISNRNVWLGTP